MYNAVKSCWWTPFARTCALLALALFLLGGEPAALAQMPTATILGVVRDTSGALVPGAAVTARNQETGQSRSTVTAADGTYRFPALAVGSYELRIEQPGFRTALRSGLTLAVAQEAVVNFALELGAVEQTVSVVAEAPLVTTTSGSLGGLVSEQKVAELPLNGRNYVDLAILQPGITTHEKKNQTLSGWEGNWFSSSGAPPRSNNYLLDGASMVNYVGGSANSTAGTTLGVDGIREFRLLTNAFSAEYGMTMGSQMVIVSKNGTNQLHASLFEYVRNSALDARNFFDYRTTTTPRRLPAFTRNQFGAAAGGPLRRDKAFFHATYEGLREVLGETRVSRTIPPASRVGPGIADVMRPIMALFPEPNLPNSEYTFSDAKRTTENYGQIRFDQNLAAVDTLFVRYTIDNTGQNRVGNWPAFGEDATSRSQFATLSESHVFSPVLLNTFRFSLSRTVLGADTTSTASGPGVSFVPGWVIGALTIGGLSTGVGINNLPRAVKQNIFTWSDDVFYTLGRHSLKFGALFNHYQQYVNLTTFVAGRANFASVATFLAGQPIFYSAVTPGSIWDRTYHYTTMGFYMQDDMAVSPRLTLNMGLRYEILTTPQEARGRGSALRDIVHDTNFTLGPPMKNPSLRNISPRLGFAWDATGNGAMAVRGGFALLYDVGNFGTTFLMGSTGSPPFSSVSQVNSPALMPVPFIFPREAEGKSIRGPNYQMQQPHILHYNLTVERRLPFEMGLMLSYAGSRGLNLLRQREGNNTLPQILGDGRRFWTGTDPRINPNWDSFALQDADGNSWYNSLQVGLTKRLSRGLQFQSSYTWSRLIDETQGQAPADATGRVTLSSNRRVDHGPAEFDLKHNWRVNTIYRLPNWPSGTVPEKLLNGWWISGIFSLRAGYPLTPRLTNNRSRSRELLGQGGDRPDLIPGIKHSDLTGAVSRGCESIPAGTPLKTPERWFDPCGFSIQPIGFLGNSGIGILRGPRLTNVDLSLAKDTALGFLGESGKLEFRAEFFNILNRANLGIPDEQVLAGTADRQPPLAPAGRISATATTSRQIQLSLKVLF